MFQRTIQLQLQKQYCNTERKMIIQKYIGNLFSFRKPKYSGESLLSKCGMKSVDVRSCISPALTLDLDDPSSSEESEDESRTSTDTSIMSVDSLSYYGLNDLKCPFARPSKIVRKSSLPKEIEGDGDCWYEVKLRSKKTGNIRSFFYSTKTGKRVRDEPPTGASRVIYIE